MIEKKTDVVRRVTVMCIKCFYRPGNDNKYGVLGQCMRRKEVGERINTIMH